MAQSKKVFIAPSAFFAFVDRANIKHLETVAYFRYFAEQKYQLFTSLISIEEAYEEVYQKISPSLAKDFIRGITLSNINILYPTESDTKAALKALINYRNTDLKFKEAQMAVLASRNYISQICTFEYLHALFGLQPFYLPI